MNKELYEEMRNNILNGADTYSHGAMKAFKACHYMNLNSEKYPMVQDFFFMDDFEPFTQTMDELEIHQFVCVNRMPHLMRDIHGLTNCGWILSGPINLHCYNPFAKDEEYEYVLGLLFTRDRENTDV